MQTKLCWTSRASIYAQVFKMPKTYKIARTDLAFALILLFLIGFTAGTFLSPQKIAPQQLKTVSVNGSRVIQMGIPAVDENGNGVIGTLLTTVRPGSGQVLVNVNDVLAQFDTQLSGRNAAKAASEATGIDLSNIDVIYDIRVNASVIEGPSAGAALASSIALALEGIPANNKVMMTGTIEDNGSIGKIGAVLEKATAAKASGTTIFLVPSGQGTEMSANRTRVCDNIGFMQVCHVNYDYKNVSIGSELNITVQEVGTLKDILNVYKNLNNSNSTAK